MPAFMAPVLCVCLCNFTRTSLSCVPCSLWVQRLTLVSVFIDDFRNRRSLLLWKPKLLNFTVKLCPVDAGHIVCDSVTDAQFGFFTAKTNCWTISAIEHCCLRAFVRAELIYRTWLGSNRFSPLEKSNFHLFMTNGKDQVTLLWFLTYCCHVYGFYY